MPAAGRWSSWITSSLVQAPAAYRWGPGPHANDRWIALASPTFGWANAGPLVGDVVISEIHNRPIDPDGNGPLKAKDFQFIELYNRTASAIDLTGWQLAGDVDFAFPEGTRIGAHETQVVVSYNPAVLGKASVFRFTLGMSASAPLAGPYKGSLDGAEGHVQLVRLEQPPVDPSDFTPLLVVDEVHYRSVAPWPISPAGSGESLARTGPGEYGDLPASWLTRTPSPGIVDFVVTQPGDANEDGSFDQLDLVLVRQQSKYMTGQPASWTEGDWNGDGVFNQLDLVAALAAGNFGTREIL